MASNELFEVEVGGGQKFKGVKQEMKSVLERNPSESASQHTGKQ